MRVFIVMPFAPEYHSVYSAIREACKKASVTSLRADEIKQLGPIINQIFDSITNADCVIAEVSDKNPNVYYEVAVAHCMEKPTILLARQETIKEIPFDIRHNRMLLYDAKNLKDMVKKLVEHLIYLKANIVNKGQHPTIEKYLGNLSSMREKPKILLNELINQVAEDFTLTDAKLIEEKFLEQEGFLITVKDAFGERVVLLLDINGIIRRKKKL